MSVESTCDFCGFSDKTRCRTQAHANGCIQYKEVRNRNLTTKINTEITNNVVPILMTLTIAGQSGGEIVVTEKRHHITVSYNGKPQEYLKTEIPLLITALKTILKTEKR